MALVSSLFSFNRALILVALCGFGVAAIFAATLLKQDIVLRMQMNQGAQIVDLVAAGGAAIHEVQKERGTTSAFLAAGSDEFRNRMMAQRLKADAALKIFVDALNATTVADPDFENAIANVRDNLANHPSLRRQIERGAISRQEAVQALTVLNRSIISLGKRGAHLLQSAELARAMVAHTELLLAKDVAGLERATGSAGFAVAAAETSLFPTAILTRFEALIGIQDALFKNFRDLASDELAKSLDRTGNNQATLRVAELRSVAHSGNVTNVSTVTGTAFFDAMTAKIDLIQALEKQSISDVETKIVQNAAAAQRQFILHVAIFAVAVLTIGGFCVLLTRALAFELRATVSRMNGLSQGDLDTEIPNNRFAEMARIGDAMRVFREKEKERRAAEERADVMFRQTREMIDGVVHAVRQHDFSTRLPVKDLEGAASLMAAGANSILASAEEAVAEQKQNDSRLNKSNAASQKNQALASEELAKVTSAYASGDFGQRISLDGKSGQFRAVCESINQIATGIDSTLSETNRCISAMAQGDLSVGMNGQYQGAYAQLQTNLNAMVQSLGQLIGQISNSGHNIAKSSEGMRSTAETLSTQAKHNAGSVARTSAALEEMSGSVREVARNVNDVQNTAVEARKTAISSEQIASDAAASMDRIADASSKISDAVKVIDDIAFQINLLALNAGVEAARAGEAGRGFSVVASEVRALAQRSADAAKEIGSVISVSDAAVADGVSNVTAAKTSLETITKSVVRIAENVEQISETVDSQVGGLDKINKAVAEIDRNTQSQGATFQDVNTSSHDLAKEADVLQDTVAHFKTDQFQKTPRKDSKTLPSSKMGTSPKKAKITLARNNLAKQDQDWKDF